MANITKDGNITTITKEKDKPFSFKIGAHSVIKGWEVGVKTMKVGEKAEIKIGFQLFYNWFIGLFSNFFNNFFSVIFWF